MPGAGRSSRARPDRRVAIAWLDAHGDGNTPETTPTGNVWGMPFALLSAGAIPSSSRRPTARPSTSATPP
jgi:arginase family enzyme